jgi:hypothetical protein
MDESSSRTLTLDERSARTAGLRPATATALVIRDGGWKHLSTGAWSGDLGTAAQGIDGQYRA